MLTWELSCGPPAGLVATSFAMTCFDQHYEKVFAAAGFFAGIRPIISSARQAFTRAWNAAGPGNQAIIISTVRVSQMFGWIGLGVLGAATVGYGAYLAYQCYSNRQRASWQAEPLAGPRLSDTLASRRASRQRSVVGFTT